MKKRLNKKILFSAVAGVAATAAVSTAVAMKIEKPFKPSFYNYKAYISKGNLDELNKNFEYKTFDEINEFNNAIINNKAVAGIGVEYLAAKLAGEGRIAKIDYSILFSKNDQPIKEIQILATDDAKTRALKKLKTENLVKLSLRPEVFNHLSKYDEFISRQIAQNQGKKYIEGQNDHKLWEYFYPYFSQDAVVAYNGDKVKIPTNLLENPEEDPYTINFGSDEAVKNHVKELGPTELVNIFKTLRQAGYQKFLITDSVRDNMLYGSSYWLLPKSNDDQEAKRTASEFTGEVLDTTYRRLIDYFTQIIKDGTGFDVKDDNHVSFNGDGLEILNRVIKSAVKYKDKDFEEYTDAEKAEFRRANANTDTAGLMYNGDAIDGYYGSDNVVGYSRDGALRAVKPANNILLIDGLVLSSGGLDISDAQRARVERNNVEYIKHARDSIFAGMHLVYDKAKETNFDLAQTLDLKTEAALDKLQRFNEELQKDYWLDLKARNLNASLSSTEAAANKYFSSLIKDETKLEQTINSFIQKMNPYVNLSLNEAAYNRWVKAKNEHIEQLKEGNNEDSNIEERINISPIVLSEAILANDNLASVKEYAQKIVELAKTYNNNAKALNAQLANFVATKQDNILVPLHSLLVEKDDEGAYKFASGLYEKVKETEGEEEQLSYAALVLARLISMIDLNDSDQFVDGEEKYFNLDNFAFVNYVPSRTVDYELVSRNYFMDILEGQDKNAINLYEINDIKGVIQHEAIQPVDNKLQSQITTYYFNKTKS
ncbi:hypothetical protein ACJA23_02270 [Mycoplasma corogypsi]|uniref:hypothetical protein n=1 Tax=Mycoplasma corogypsi TaxID=2106 RepID=UPI0038737488